MMQRRYLRRKIACRYIPPPYVETSSVSTLTKIIQIRYRYKLSDTFSMLHYVLWCHQQCPFYPLVLAGDRDNVYNDLHVR